MDVICANCAEPWDTYHLRNDEVHETDAGTQMIHDQLDAEEFEKKHRFSPPPADMCFRPSYTGEAWHGKLTPFWREQFDRRGWEFGESLYTVLHCPCCPKGERTPEEREAAAGRRAMLLALSDCYGDDVDGIIADTELALGFGQE